jgi:hypothetical protein
MVVTLHGQFLDSSEEFAEDGMQILVGLDFATCC